MENYIHIKYLKEFLEGSWRLARVIDDRRMGQAGRLRGHAVFAPFGQGLRYREHGRMHLGPHSGWAERESLLNFPREHLARVRFHDGRPFHDLDLTSGRWDCEHLCGADRYHGEFLALGAGVLAVRWRVAGPRKDYVLVSRYRRDAGAAGQSRCSPARLAVFKNSRETAGT